MVQIVTIHNNINSINNNDEKIIIIIIIIIIITTTKPTIIVIIAIIIAIIILIITIIITIVLKIQIIAHEHTQELTQAKQINIFMGQIFVCRCHKFLYQLAYANIILYISCVKI